MRTKPLLTFFVLVFAWIWIIAAFVFLFPEQVSAVFGPMSGSNPLFLLAVWGPNVVALILTAAWNGKQGIVDLLKKYTIWRVDFRWYVLIMLGLPAVGLAAALLAGTFSTSLVGNWNSGSFPRLLALLFSLIITGALGEEIGWRGFALPRLLQKWSPLVSSLILGALWGLWHLPGFLASGTPQSGLSLPAFILGAIALSVIVTWIYLHSRGSLLLAALVHFMANFALNGLGAPLTMYSLLLSLLILILITSQARVWFARPVFSS